MIYPNWIRRLPVLGLILDPTAEDFDKKRISDRGDKAEQHRQKAVEMMDSAAWAQKQAEYHTSMVELYK